MTNKPALILFILLLLCHFPSLHARGPKIHFKQLSLDEGLSQNSVLTIMQDRKGFLWFGTQDGINKYDGYTFTAYKPDSEDPDTLSHNWITELFEDRDGNIWIGTISQGLNRFDPHTEKFYRYPFTTNTTSPNALNGSYVQAICQDINGDILVGMRGWGISRLIRKKGEADRFAHYQRDPSRPETLRSTFIMDLLVDDRGTLWVGSLGGGLAKFNRESETFTHYLFNPSDPQSLSGNNVTNICLDRAGMLWLATFNGLSVMDRASGTFTVYRNQPGNPSSLSSNQLNFVYEDRSGVIWVGTVFAGLCRFNKRTETFDTYRRVNSDPTSLSSDNIFSIYEDRSRVVWVGTNGGGLNRFERDNKFQLLRSDPNNSNSLSDSFIYAIFEDRDHLLWVGTNSGGLNRLDRTTGKYTHYRNSPGNGRSLGAAPVRTILEDSYGKLWVGTQGTGLYRFNRKTNDFARYVNVPGDSGSLSSNNVGSLLEDRSGMLWVGAQGGTGLHKYNRETDSFSRISIPGNLVYKIYESRSQPGILWIGMVGLGLNRYDTKSGSTVTFAPDTSDPHTLSHDTVLAVHEDKNATIWLGTYGGGLNKMVKDADGSTRFAHYTEKNGLVNNSIYGIMEDQNGLLWISTNKGLSSFNPKTEYFKNFNVRNGLQGNEFNGGAYFKNKRGEMFFGGLNGMNIFYPARVKARSYIAPIVVTGFTLSNKTVPIGPGSPLSRSILYTDKINLNHRQNAFTFEFSSLDFSIPENNRYFYKMEGFDENWNPTGSDKRYAAYTNLSPNTYVFRVKGSNSDGIWNKEGTSITIEITPPYWQTWWFRVLLFVIFIAVMVLGFRRRFRNERLKVELQTARDAQMSIMPQQDPAIKGFDISGICIPAHEVGGDFFDYIWMGHDKSTLAIAIGDVSGKAMKSAMTAVMTNGIIYSKMDECLSVQEVMQQANRPLYFKTGKNMFTALCLAALNIELRELTFTNAGLHSPLLKSGGSSKVVPLHGEGDKLPLGIRKEPHYKEKKQSLYAGDVLIFFTDGLPESKNLADEFYGYDTLMKLVERTEMNELTAAQIKNFILSDIRRFSENANQHDDMTVVVLKVL